MSLARTVVIFGGARGIGAAVATLFAAAGDRDFVGDVLEPLARRAVHDRMVAKDARGLVCRGQAPKGFCSGGCIKVHARDPQVALAVQSGVMEPVSRRFGSAPEKLARAGRGIEKLDPVPQDQRAPTIT